MDNLLAENCQDNFCFSMESFCVPCILAKTKSLGCFFFKIMNMSLFCFVSSHPQVFPSHVAKCLLIGGCLIIGGFSPVMEGP